MSENPQLSLTKRESQVLWILWRANKPLIASQIVKAQEGLNINTVQAVLRSLLKRKLIEVAEIVYSGTVLSRSYQPSPLAMQYNIDSFALQYQMLAKKIPSSSLLAALVDSEKDGTEVIGALEKILAEKKRGIEKE